MLMDHFDTLRLGYFIVHIEGSSVQNKMYLKSLRIVFMLISKQSRPNLLHFINHNIMEISSTVYLTNSADPNQTGLKLER